MKTAIVMLACAFLIGFTGTTSSQTVEVAGKCDDLQKKLEDLVKKPDLTDAQKIKDAIGVDVLDACATAEGQITCYQCVDKDGTLRALQLLRKADSKGLTLLGFGCPCTKQK
jgi:hypothetical protein